jgi:hypothetical protein
MTDNALFHRNDVLDFLRDYDMTDMQVLLDAVSCKIETVELHIRQMSEHNDDNEMRAASLTFSRKLLAKLRQLRAKLEAAMPDGAEPIE